MRRSERIKRKSRPIIPVKKKTATTDTMTMQKSSGGGFYDREYKKLLIIPVALLVIAILSIALQVFTTGDFINRGVSLKGGLLITVPEAGDGLVEAIRESFPQYDIESRKLQTTDGKSATTISADIAPEDQAQVEQFLDTVEQASGVRRDDFSIETIGSSLGESFFHQTLRALFIAFLFMGFVVFLYFGEGNKIKAVTGLATMIAGLLMFNGGVALSILSLLIGIALFVTYAKFSIPSIAVILAAFSDIVITLAIVNLIGIKVSTAGIAAFLMLIGYSVDTDILLSTRVLKRTAGSVYDRVISALKTGMTMNITTMAALLVGIVFSKSEVITQIMTIILIGLVVDMINTWIQNVGILRWYLERKNA